MAESRLYINRQFNRQILKDIGAKLDNGYNIFVILSYDSDRGDKEVAPSPVDNFIMDDLDYVYDDSDIIYVVKTDKTENLLVAADNPITEYVVTFKGRNYYTSTFDNIGDKKFDHLYVAPEVVASYENQPEPDGPIYYNTTTILLANITASQTHYDYTLDDPDEINLNEVGTDKIILAQARHTNKVLPKSSPSLTKDEKTLYMMLKI